MSIDEAINHCEEVAEKNEKECKNWAYGASQINDDENRKKQYQKHAEMWHECAKEHRQLAEWLRELELYRETLIGRPCEVCEFHKTGSCSRWKCVFEEVNADEDGD